MRKIKVFLTCLSVAFLATNTFSSEPGIYRILLSKEMIRSEAPEKIDFSVLTDEQLDAGDPPSAKLKTTNGYSFKEHKFSKELPVSAVVDLGKVVPLARVWFYDINDIGSIGFQTGSQSDWSEEKIVETTKYSAWTSVNMDCETRYIRITVKDQKAKFGEIAVDAYSPAGWSAKQSEIAEAKRKEEEKALALKKAKEDALKRPIFNVPPFGKLSLIEEINPGDVLPDWKMTQSPAKFEVRDILGKKAFVLPTQKDESSYISFRLGKLKMLRAGGAYVVTIEYPEDAPRSINIINCGNETLKGFSTGLSLGDAMHPKYVNNLVESLNLPLSGEWKTWSSLFWLHDKTPDKGWLKAEGKRVNSPEDGFDVTICQFSQPNVPLSKGIAIGRIRLYEVIDEASLKLELNMPPKELPRRHLFWREEMADGILNGKDPKDRGIVNRLDWYTYKANLMSFLGMNTFSKDLLEFGACQHWDPSEGQKNFDWMYYQSETKELWGQIVDLMTSRGFDLVPYYEYAGSKGQASLGFKRACKPLTRDDAYTHIKWIESANADITDPAIIEDFKKVLKYTVVKFADKADFAGIWIRPRAQMPVSFGNEALARFAKESNNGIEITRNDLKSNNDLYKKYITWWNGKRREFFTAMRDYLRENGIKDAQVLYTGCMAEPGKVWADWTNRFITDDPSAWKEVLSRKENLDKDGKGPVVITPQEIADAGTYKKALLSSSPNWGGWELNHSSPPDDPADYRDTDGILFSHAFNRNYTVLSPATFDEFRGKNGGLFMARHFSLNENMMFDSNDKFKLGYFVCDIEHSGPYSMMAEVLAMANGNPTIISYLSGSSYSRGFPYYVRDFNANFLALPALPAVDVKNACADADIVVRKIDAGKAGVYYAVINISSMSKKGAKITLSGAPEKLSSTTKASITANTITIDMHPYQLASFRVK